MNAGKDFPSPFGEDLFKIRRSPAFAAGNPYDPESLLTGEEIAQGLTYANSYRDWPSESQYNRAVGGEIDTQTILRIAPRVRKAQESPMQRLAGPVHETPRDGFVFVGPIAALAFLY